MRVVKGRRHRFIAIANQLVHFAITIVIVGLTRGGLSHFFEDSLAEPLQSNCYRGDGKPANPIRGYPISSPFRFASYVVDPLIGRFYSMTEHTMRLAAFRKKGPSLMSPARLSLRDDMI